MSWNGIDSDWTEAVTNRLRELHAIEGANAYSMTEIARRLNIEFGTNFSRNAVIGRCRRMGLTARPSPIVVKHSPKGRVPRMKTIMDAPTAVVKPKCESVSIYQLDWDNCHYPLGEIEAYPPYRYCGKPAQFGRSWCDEHWRVTHGAGAGVIIPVVAARYRSAPL
jgi:GcrA cell cycle regulator